MGPVELASAAFGQSFAITPIQLITAISAAVNGGYYYEPYSYYKVTNHDGSEVLLKSSDKKGDQVISESTSGVMRKMLQTVCTAGTGKAYGVSRFTTFGKTGTTSDNKDHWFIGVTPYYSTAVWWGYDHPAELSVNYTSHPPTTAWRNVMNIAQANLPSKSFPVSRDVVVYNYCTLTGNIANANCPDQKEGYYKKSTIDNNLISVCQAH